MISSTDRCFKFSDVSTGWFPMNYKFISFLPTHMYSSTMLGFGEWIKLR